MGGFGPARRPRRAPALLRKSDMDLVAATPTDADFLLRLRNDPLTRAMSLASEEVASDAHAAWLAAMLADPRRQLFVAREGEPVGSGRIDMNGEGAELSWTIGPEHRGRGYGLALVRALIAAAPPGPLTARIKSANTASLAIAARCGFVEVAAEGGLQVWRREAGGVA